MTLGAIPPQDRRKDDARRYAMTRRSAQWGVTMLLALAQFVLAAALGYWAGSAVIDGQHPLSTQAAVGMVVVLACAHVVAYGAVLLCGSVALLVELPRLLRKPRPDPEPARGEGLASTLVRLAVVVAHSLALLAGALLLCLLLASGSDGPGFGAWWRFLLAAIALVPLSPALLSSWSKSDR